MGTETDLVKPEDSEYNIPCAERYKIDPAMKRGCSSVVERQLPKLNVAGSSPVSRFYIKPPKPLGFGGFFYLNQNPH
jgi:hypothetical protein|tara:strand:+ start:70464 stop:70694 length:231 start_codon:yes stop_codon:yes gene_type:complete